MARIFLSHSSRDDLEAVAVRDWLASEGWDDVFLDFDPNRGIVAGQRWEQRLHEAASRCEAVVFLVSAHWLASGWCIKEYTTARRLNKMLFAVLIDAGRTLQDLPPELTDTWQVTDLTGGRDPLEFRAVRPGTQEERQVRFNRDGLTRLKRGLQKAGLDARYFAWPPAGEPDRAPFRGLRPLEAEDAGLFFGRDAPIVEAVDRLRGLRTGAAPRLMVILGASGAGKSSFLRAGLLPRLARNDAHFVVLPPIRPELAAISGESGLARSLAAACPGRPAEEVAAALAAGAAGLRPLLAGLVDAAFRRTLAEAGSVTPPMVVIAIDQAEELFRADGAAEAQQLLALVRELATTDDPVAVAVIFVIRSDSYDALEHARALEGLRQDAIPLLPMPRGAYKDVIEGPAQRVAEAGGRLAIEPQLTERLLEDVQRGAGSDALPLLAFTLEQLYRGRPGREAWDGVLRLADYEASGGLAGAIEAAVARAFVRADADPRIPRDRAARETLLRRGLIPWLAGIDPETRTPRRSIARLADIPAEAAPLTALLIEERLLATDIRRAPTGFAGGDGARGAPVATVEPIHEALLRQWGLLSGWLSEDFGLLAALEAVQRAARDWDANARDAAWLAHGGSRLAEAQGLDARVDIAAKLDGTDRAYLAACREHEEAMRAAIEQRRREREAEQQRQVEDAHALTAATRRTAQRTRIGLAVALVLAAAAVGFGLFAKGQKTLADLKTQEAVTQRNAAETSRKEAETSRTRADASAVEARRSADVAQRRLREGQRNESAALAERSLARGAAGDWPGALLSAIEALPADLDRPDRPILARALYALRKAVWDYRLRFQREIGTDAVNEAILSPDGRTVAVSGRDGGLHLLDAATGAGAWDADSHRQAAYTSAFSADGRLVATLYQEPQSIVVREAATGKPVQDIFVNAMAASPGVIAFLSGGQLAFAGGAADPKVRIFEVASGRSLAVLPFGRDFFGATTSIGTFDGGHRFYAASSSSVQMWDAATHETLLTNWQLDEPPKDPAAHFSLPGRDAIGYLCGIKALGGDRRLLLRDESRLFVLSDPDRKLLRSWTYSQAIGTFLIDVFLVLPKTFGREDLVALPTTTTEIGLFEVSTGSQRLTLRGHTTGIVSASASADGAMIAALAKDGTIRVWATQDARQMHLFKLPDAARGRLAFTPDGRSLLAHAGRSVFMFALDDRGTTGPRGAGRIMKLADPAGSTALVADANTFAKSAQLVDLGDGRVKATLPKSATLDADDDRAVFSPDGSLLAFAVKDAYRASGGLAGLAVAAGLAVVPEQEGGTTAIAIADAADGRIRHLLPVAEGGDRQLFFSPDARHLCVVQSRSSRDAIVRFAVVGTDDGREVARFEQEGETGRCLFAGPTLLAISERGNIFDATMLLSGWDLASGKRLYRTAPLAADGLSGVSLVANGSRILLAGTQHPPVVLEAATGRTAFPLDDTLVGVSTVTPIGRDRLKLERPDGSWAVWDAATRIVVPHLSSEEQGKLVATSADGRSLLLLSGSQGVSTLRVLETEGGRTLLDLPPIHSDKPPETALDDESRHLAVGVTDGEVAIHDLSRPGAASRTIGLDGRLRSMRFLSAGRLLLTVLAGNRHVVWDAATGERTAGFEGVPEERAVATPKSPSDLVALVGNGARLVDARSGEEKWRSGERQIVGVQFSGDGSRAAVLYPDGVVVIDAAAGREIAAFPVPMNHFAYCDLAPDGTHLVLSGPGGDGVLLDLADGRRVAEFGDALSVAWGGSKDPFLALGAGRQLHIRPLSAPDRDRRIDLPAALQRLSVDPSGEVLLAGCADGSVLIVDARGGTTELLIRLRKPAKWLAFAGSKDRALVYEESSLLTLWQASPAKPLGNFMQRWSGKLTFGWRAQADPSGRLLAVVSPDHWVRTFDLATGRLVFWSNAGVAYADAVLADDVNLYTLQEGGYLEHYDVRQSRTLPAMQLSAGTPNAKWESLAVLGPDSIGAMTAEGAVLLVSRTFGKAEAFGDGGRFEGQRAVLSRDGAVLTTVDTKAQVRIWDVAAHAAVAAWTVRPPAGWWPAVNLTLRMSADDRRVIVGERRRDVAAIELPPTRPFLLAEARRLVGPAATARGNGAVEGPRLGIAMRPVAAGDLLPPAAGKGALLIAVVPNTPAFQGGLQVGDVIVSIDGKPVTEVAGVTRAVAAAVAGGDMVLAVVRRGERLSLSIHF